MNETTLTTSAADTPRISPHLRKVLPCLLIAAAPWLLPVPEGLAPQAFHALGIFVATIVAFITRPAPMGPVVLTALVVSAATGSVPYKALIGSFGDTTVWLVVSAFLIAGVVEQTGFGRRLALLLVERLGRSITGLGYAICGAELLLGPLVPSNTARGSIMAPIVESLSGSLGSRADEQPERAGRYLALVGAHANLITAAMFLTGMAANPLVSRAAQAAFGIDFGWGTWALGAVVPGLLGLIVLPLVLRRLAPPTIDDVEPARRAARAELDRMGTWTSSQKTMAWVFGLLVALWCTTSVHGLGAGLVALIGLSILLITGTTRWNELVRNHRAWDTLVWLGGLLAMANALADLGAVQWFADHIQSGVAGISGVWLVVILGLIYFVSMYGFSMLTAHISAFVAAFLAVAAGADAPPMLAVAVMAYFSTLCACTTNYSTGPVIIYFGLGFVPSEKWFKTGAWVAVLHLVVWLSVGLGWWKLLGWW